MTPYGGPAGAQPATPGDEGEMTAVLAAVGEPSRLRLLRLLLEGERCVSQCTEHTGMVQSLVSKHLSRLIAAGLVQRRKSGRRSYHRVIDPEGLQELLRVAERLAHHRGS